MRRSPLEQRIGFVATSRPEEPDAVALGSAPMPDDPVPESWFMLGGKRAVRNVSVATLTPVLPTVSSTGAAVIVAAGGGYLIESIDNEAWAQARWLAARGIAAFILKYRLQPTPVDDEAFAAALIARFTAAADPEARRQIDVPDFMVDDAAAAVRLVRDHADDWGVDASRLGYLGFSAGAMIGLRLVATAAPDTLPAFLGAIYPSMTGTEVRTDAPPLFIAMAADDQLYGTQGYGLAESWRRAGRSIELHVYAKGGHGFGMGAPGTTTTGTMNAFYAWLRSGGWLGDTREISQ